MKFCNRCKVNERFSQSDSRRSLCRKCKQSDQDKMRTKRLLWIRSEKQKTGCVRCGYNEHFAALDFHHLGEKKFTIGWNLFRGYKAIKSEMEKCEVLCANCHRVETFAQRCFAGKAWGKKRK